MMSPSSPPGGETLPQDPLEIIVSQRTLPIRALKQRSLPQWSMRWLPIWHNALLPYLCTRFVLVIVGLLSSFYILPLMAKHSILPSPVPFPQVLWLMWRRFDSGFYMQIAWHGYQPASALHSSSNWAFYPLYPLLISGFGRLLGGNENGFALAGWLIANLAALVAVSYLYMLVSREFSARIASRTVLYLSIYPLSFYLSAIYPEALFLAFAIASIYYARQRSWWISGLCGGLAALTRAEGIVLFLPLAYEYLQTTAHRYLLTSVGDQSWMSVFMEYVRGLLRAARDLKNWFTSIACFLIPAGLFCFMFYAQLKTGDWLATSHTEKWGWGRQLSPPWRLLIYSLRHPIIGQPMNWNFWPLNILLAFAFLGFVIWTWRKLPVAYALYTTAMVLLPLSSNQLDSFGRYTPMAFPVLILLALRGVNNGRVHTLILVSFAAIQATLMILYVLGIPAIA